MTTLNLDIQRPAPTGPADDDLQRYVLAALPPEYASVELCIRIVDAQESAQLNERYRGKVGATNVLSFSSDVRLPELTLLGDLVICAPVVVAEAQAQAKAESAHWAHMVVHGVLHLLGYDHISDHDAEIMENKERDILSQLGFCDPYVINNDLEGA